MKENMDAIHQELYKNHTVIVWYDEFAPDPREWDNLGRMYCFGRDHYGDHHELDKDSDEFADEETGRPDLRKLMDSVRESESDILLPIFIYDHSGVSISTVRTYPYDDPWDSGVLGFYHVPTSKIRKEFNRERITKNIRNRALAIAELEVETYNNYLTGTGHGWTTYAPDGRILDSVGGYLGDIEQALCEARANIDCYITEENRAIAFEGVAFAL